MKIVCVSLVVLVALAGCDRTEVVEMPGTRPCIMDEDPRYRGGIDAYGEGDYEAAYRIWLEMAEDGNACAQYAVALLLNRGRGVTRDDVASIQWYRKSAEQGLIKSAFELGIMMHYGYGVSQSMTQLERQAEGAEWTRIAADAGHADAQYWLGQLYEMGSGVPHSMTEAAKWYRRAASLGNADALGRLGNFTLGDEQGDSVAGIEADEADAIAILMRGGEARNLHSIKQLDELHAEGRLPETAFSKIVRMYRAAASAGDDWAKSDLAEIYLNDDRIERNPGGAAALLEELRDAGAFQQYASARLATLYMRGDGVNRDIRLGFEMLDSIEQPSGTILHYRLGFHYAYGDSGTVDNVRAVKEFILSMRYSNALNQDVARASVRARKQFEDQLSPQEIARAYRMTAYTFPSGRGYPEADARALTWWQAAEELDPASEDETVDADTIAHYADLDRSVAVAELEKARVWRTERFVGPPSRDGELQLGDDGLAALVYLETIRSATEDDLAAWKQAAKSVSPGRADDLERAAIEGRTYVVERQTALPYGLIGSRGATFILSARAPRLLGPFDDIIVFSMSDFTCQPVCGR